MVNIKDLIAKQPEVLSVLKQIGKIADEVNKEVYGVGGVVRDLILDRKIKEVDLASAETLFKLYDLENQNLISQIL